MIKKFAFTLTFVLLLSLMSMAEVIRLKGNVFIQGTILKRTNKLIIIDLGYDVLRIPRSEIVETLTQMPQAEAKEEAKNHLFSTKSMAEISTQEGVRQFGPAVVTIKSPRGLGSGFIINPLGYVITNFHVIKGQKHISIIRFKKMNETMKRIVHNKVQIVALDSFHDIAVLQITDNKNDPLPFVFLAPQEQGTIGEKIFVIGNPLGLERTVTEGVLSHTGRNFGGQIFLQIDAAINPGNSGGPLFNNNGEVIGVINMGITRMQGLNFAIPIWQVKFVLNHVDLYTYNEANPLSGYFYSSPPPNPNKKKDRAPRRK